MVVLHSFPAAQMRKLRLDFTLFGERGAVSHEFFPTTFHRPLQFST